MKSSLRFLSILAFMLESCGPVLYSNVGQNVPLFKEKGEFTGNVGLNTSFGVQDASGIGIQAAYSPSDHLAIISSFSSMGNSSEGWSGSGSYFELGGGYFGSNPDKKMVYEILGGVGFGAIKNRDKKTSYVNANFIKPFIQPSLGFSVPNFEVAFTPRIGMASFSRFSYNMASDGENELSAWMEEYDGSFLLEPGLTVRGGFRYVKLQLQYVYSSFGDELYSNTGFFSLGMQFLISEKRYGSRSNQ